MVGLPAARRLSASEKYQNAFHRAFEKNLFQILDGLPIPPHARVLDVPCGNGFYTARLAARLGDGGRIVAVDADENAVRETAQRLADVPAKEVRQADAYGLPYADASFDVVWSAQSLISLDPTAAVREMRRVVTADGLVAILEVDEFHHVVLPWPVELEAALPAAVHRACVERYGSGGKLSPARRLRRVLKACGFGTVKRVTHAIDRAAPFDRPTVAFLRHHVRHLRSLVYPHLSPPNRELFDRLTDGPASLFHRPDAEFICLNAIYLARPTPAAASLTAVVPKLK
jgi:ubiquinone/menaquinone biosynthesis C-methylase UbiE